ncbi:family 43 glycosylhydrolase [Plebeiibacterium sediminum]|uniref:Family 43 glycosylhydrolase n=1 Tax=Plebeiibacterium sediminum TaxID=2992112 RepID=A0AAE3M388_9BACT|nr:family 43 glycosylhydrolase [Plebeiobacterium sediminum]MCW3786314.1 family 43 glycosylhydrolase [Plebeiobacterium sediminum]
MIKPFYIISLVLLIVACKQQENTTIKEYDRNPLLPGYFADPTIKKFDDTYYIYSTTDGVKLASGEPTVWISKDMVNWYNHELDIDLPEGLTNCWAPDVVKGNDGKYYYYMGNCQFGCNIYGYMSDNPIGPWSPLNEGKPVIPVGSGKEGLPALDAQFMLDDDGKLYSYFGTWCSSFGGLGWAEVDGDNMFTMKQSGLIPTEQLPQVFEAAYPLKRNGKYIIMYSSGDCRLSSYAVHYAYADSPTGPFKYGANNPILQTNEDKTVDSPGHHSIIEIDGHTYILYHRHDNPHSSGGEFRQVCMDEIVFSNDTTIEKIIPTHTGVKEFKNVYENIAFGATVEASSAYHLQSKATVYTQQATDYLYKPAYITDDNNGTMWKAENCTLPQSVTIDLGDEKSIARICTQFEYATYYYQYKIEVSQNKKDWTLFSDQTHNQTPGSPMIDDSNATCRYIRITITGTEKTGVLPAIWNVKVYDELFETPAYKNRPVTDAHYAEASNQLEVLFDASDLKLGAISTSIANQEALHGEFVPVGNCTIKKHEGKKALYLDGKSYLELSESAKDNFNWNAPYSTSAWIYATTESIGQCIISWNSREDMLQASYVAMMYGNGNFGAIAHGDGSVDVAFENYPAVNKWHHVAVTFDGMKEVIYVDGQKDQEFPINLFVRADKIRIGSSGFEPENFTGYLNDVRLYNKALNKAEVEELYQQSKN